MNPTIIIITILAKTLTKNNYDFFLRDQDYLSKSESAGFHPLPLVIKSERTGDQEAIYVLS
jgi:hypothetical protein